MSYKLAKVNNINKNENGERVFKLGEEEDSRKGEGDCF